MSEKKELNALLKKFKNIKSSKGSFLEPKEDPVAYFTLKVEILDQNLLMENADKIFDFHLRKFFAHTRYLVLRINDVVEVIAINPIRENIESVIDAENHKHVFRLPLGKKCFAEDFKTEVNLFYHDDDMNSVFTFNAGNFKHYIRGSSKDNFLGLYYFEPLSVKFDFEWHLAGPVWLKLLQGNTNLLDERIAIETLLIKDFKLDFQRELVNSDEFMNSLFRKVIDFWVRGEESEKDMKWKYSTILKIFWQNYVKVTQTKDVKFPYFNEVMKLFKESNPFQDFLSEHICGYVPFNPCNSDLVLFFLFDRNKKKQLRKVLKGESLVGFEKTLNHLIESQPQALLDVIFSVAHAEFNGFIHLFFKKYGNLLAPIIEKNEELAKTWLGKWSLKKINPKSPEEANKLKGNSAFIHNLIFSPEFTSLPLKLVAAYDFSLHEINLKDNNVLNYDNVGQKTNANSIVLVTEIDGFDVAFTKFAYVVRSQYGWLEFNELGNILVLSSIDKIELNELRPILELSEEKIEAQEFELPGSLKTEILLRKEKKSEEFFTCEEIKEVKAAKYFYFIFYENSQKSEILLNSIGVLGFRNKSSKLDRHGNTELINPLARVGFEVKKIIRPYI